jgi:hypothetical protein
MHGKVRKIYTVSVVKAEGKTPPGRSECRWEHNLERILRKQDRKVWTGCIWLRSITSGGIL